MALTFDACSTRDVSKYDARITRELVLANAPATLFLGGSWAREEAAHVKELAGNPLFVRIPTMPISDSDSSRSPVPDIAITPGRDDAGICYVRLT